MRAGIRKVVEEMPGLEVVAEVSNGPQIFAALAEARFDCLLLDITMPDFEPVSAIRQMRADYPAMKILVVSAYDDDIYVQGLLSAGVNGYHLKDQPLSDLQLAIQRVLAGERWISGPLISKLIGPTASAAPESALNSLTGRQRELLTLLQEGLDNHSIARQTGLSVKTIENHLTRLYRQIGVQSRLEAVNYSLKHPEILGISGKEAGHTGTETFNQNEACFSALVVDDNARYRGQLQRMIGKICPQATLFEAENLANAVHLAQRIQPQLVFVDMVLGDEDGIQCTRRIKAISPQSRIILISAYPDREFHRLGLQAGAVAFLDKKDLDTATLRQVIDDTIM